MVSTPMASDRLARYFKKEADVEISSNAEGFRRSWYAGIVVRPPGNLAKGLSKTLVEYKTVTEDEKSGRRLREVVEVVQIRPPPPLENRRSFRFSEEVDAYYDDGWYEGIISEVVQEDRYLVFLRGNRELIAFKASELRLHREWVFGKWVPPLETSADVMPENEMLGSKRRKIVEADLSTRTDSFMPPPSRTATDDHASLPILPNLVDNSKSSATHTHFPTIPVQDAAFSCTGDSQTAQKKLIRPRGKEFTEELICVQVISEIIMRKYNGVWRSWKKIPESVRTIMFREFEKRFRWLEGDRWKIRKVFEHRGSEILKNRLHRARKLNQRPNWIVDELWKGLLKEWAEDDFAKISAQNKVNRASECGGKGFPLHKGGCVSHLAHKDRLKEKLGYEPELAEYFMHTHSSLNEKGELVWVNERAENTYNMFMTKWNEICDQNLQPIPTQFQVWTEMVGGANKGWVYGLGGEASFLADGFPSFAKTWEIERPRAINLPVKDKQYENVVSQAKNQTTQEEIEDVESRC